MMDLLEIRKEIDQIDSQIVELYEKRMDACKKVAQYKIETGKKVFDKARELLKEEQIVYSTDYQKLMEISLLVHHLLLKVK